MLINNKDITVKQVIKEQLKKADEIIIASPFITLNDSLVKLLESKVKLTLIFRLSYPASPKLLVEMLTLKGKKDRLYFYYDDTLHAKIYLFLKKGTPFSVIIGSSNLTESGVSSNKEMNVLMSENLAEVQEYLRYLISESDGELTRGVIKEYKKGYKIPDQPKKYKKARISSKLEQHYNAQLQRYALIKGSLEHLNNKKLPFTYVFDAFAHQFIVHMKKDLNLKPTKKFNSKKAKEYFQLFLDEYYSPEDIQWWTSRYKLSQRIKQDVSGTSVKKIRDFFLGIHSVAWGSGSGVRQSELQITKPKELRNVLDLILHKDLSMPQKYSLALTPQDKHGYKVRYLGPSSIGEVPGWLIPEVYPILNQKLVTVFEYLGV